MGSLLYINGLFSIKSGILETFLIIFCYFWIKNAHYCEPGGLFSMKFSNFELFLTFELVLSCFYLLWARLNSDKIQNFHFLSRNFHFWGKITKIITRINSWVFTNLAYIWFLKYFTKIIIIRMIIFSNIAKIGLTRKNSPS